MVTTLRNTQGQPYLSLAYDADNNWVHCVWQGEQTYASVVAGCTACLLLLEQHLCCCLLNDNRQVYGFWSDEVVEWVVADWGPRAMQLGLTHMATVLYPESLAAVYEEAMRLSMREGLQLRAFYELSAAQQWLLSHQAT
ncbi:hypothetical protein [Hymenobacter norwichensis]|uniref:hypothetical protein n=1 Tax=Hymenobacter norwichensis TaxID=223903 RepID=UPI0003B65B25|nr:hypothetical protein [Hymenobacter norwichensis]